MKSVQTTSVGCIRMLSVSFGKAISCPLHSKCNCYALNAKFCRSIVTGKPGISRPFRFYMVLFFWKAKLGYVKREEDKVEIVARMSNS